MQILAKNPPPSPPPQWRGNQKNCHAQGRNQTQGRGKSCHLIRLVLREGALIGVATNAMEGENVG
ncbi:hypothetical protein [Helicobacter sp. T3_23-1059]